MKSKFKSILSLFSICALTLTIGLPVYAHEEPSDSPQIIEEKEVIINSDCKHEHPEGMAHGDEQAEEHDHEHDHGPESYDKAFIEGTPNLFSASVLNPDTLSLFYAHNFFWSSLPRSSNPAFWLKYSPLDYLQVDAMATLRANPGEFEVGLSYQLLDEERGDWVDLTPRLAYNTRDNLVGGEIAATKSIFPELWQVGVNARLLSTGKTDGYDRMVPALGFNTILRVWKHWHLFGDLVVPLDGEILSQRTLIWTAGLKKRIPHTPHILTLFVGTGQEQSLSGRTIATSGTLADNFRLGFVFSIEIPEVSQMPARLF